MSRWHRTIDLTFELLIVGPNSQSHMHLLHCLEDACFKLLSYLIAAFMYFTHFYAFQQLIIRSFTFQHTVSLRVKSFIRLILRLEHAKKLHFDAHYILNLKETYCTHIKIKTSQGSFVPFPSCVIMSFPTTIVCYSCDTLTASLIPKKEIFFSVEYGETIFSFQELYVLDIYCLFYFSKWFENSEWDKTTPIKHTPSVLKCKMF